MLWLAFNGFYVWYMVLASMWGAGRDEARRTKAVLGGLLITIFALTTMISVTQGMHLVVYFVTGSLWGIGEIAYVVAARFWRSQVIYKRSWFGFPINALILAVTMTCWMFFNHDVVGAGCASRSSVPGHALFHMMASLSTLWTFFDFASERRVAAHLHTIN
eukprot:TRINITY_DN4348_c0_g1_i1.p4 TRINITY_DN4348_c0_g1~~TRINITY_DN4348_c0_g1_i1.p4  ORF type:complete len:161 (+),score=23.09 TRINITY_DN4348_c0_g1_i1:511-993(+)